MIEGRAGGGGNSQKPKFARRHSRTILIHDGDNDVIYEWPLSMMVIMWLKENTEFFSLNVTLILLNIKNIFHFEPKFLEKN